MQFTIKEKLDLPIIKLLRADNVDFILSFFYFVFRNKEKDINAIKQTKLEKELKYFIEDYNRLHNDEKNPNIANAYIEQWVNAGYLKRFQINEYDDDYHIELTEYSLQAMHFFETLWVWDEVYASVKSNFETIIGNLKSIALASEEYKEQNIEEIDRQIAELIKKKEKVKKWDLTVFEEEIFDKYILARDLLAKMPIDFRKVETVLWNLALEIQKKSNELDINKWEILGYTLSEIEEKITNSSQGKSLQWFNRFYQEDNSDLYDILQKIFDQHDRIKQIEKQKWVRDVIEVDLLKSKKRAYDKQTFIITKLRERFAEEVIEERRKGITLIKNIKKYYSNNLLNIKFREKLWDMNQWIDIDLFMNKNLWEPKQSMKLAVYDDVEKQDRNIDITNIFQDIWVSERKLKENIINILEDKKEVTLKELIEFFPPNAGLDELIAYYNINNIEWVLENIFDEWKEELEFNWVKNHLKVEWNKLVFIKKYPNIPRESIKKLDALIDEKENISEGPYESEDFISQMKKL